MGINFVASGMVLQAAPIGEYDKRIVILTKELGKVTAFARGARRTGSTLMAATNPFVFGEFELYQGRSTYYVRKASVANYFRSLAADYATACYGFYFLELAEYFSVPVDAPGGMPAPDAGNGPGKQLLQLLYLSLRALEKDSLDNRLVRVVFELRVLLLNGTYPDVFECRACGGREDLVLFDLENAGVLCAECAKKEGAGRSWFLSPSTVYTVQYILSSPLEKLYTFLVTDEVLAELERLTSDFYRVYIGHPFKARALLNELL